MIGLHSVPRHLVLEWAAPCSRRGKRPDSIIEHPHRELVEPEWGVKNPLNASDIDGEMEEFRKVCPILALQWWTRIVLIMTVKRPGQRSCLPIT